MGAAQELKTRLQTVFLPCLQRIAKSVKAITTANDLPPHQSELQALFAVLKVLGDVPCPPTLQAPNFSEVAAVFKEDEQLALFMTKVHKCVWEVTAKIASIIHSLDKVSTSAPTTYGTNWVVVSRYWATYEQINNAVQNVR